MAGHAGFDFVLLDLEHGPGGGVDLEHHLRAADAAGIPALVRVPTLTGGHIASALDGGAAGVVVPHVLNGEVAESAVNAAHYPPRGLRGFALSTRAGRFGAGQLGPHLEASARDTVVVVQIEDPEGVESADEILATKGVSAVLVGMNDLSIALGHPGHPEHVEVEAAVDRVMAVAAAAKVPALFVAGNVADSARWMKRGAAGAIFVASQLLFESFTQAVSGTIGSRRVAGGAPIEPLVLLPGMLCDDELWSATRRELGDLFPVVAGRIDLDDTIAGMAARMLAEAPPRFALAGHSLGAIVALEMARQAPGRITRLVLLNAGAGSPGDAQRAHWSQLQTRLAGEGMEAVAPFHAMAVLNGRADLRPAVERMAIRVGAEVLERQLGAQRSRPDLRASLGSIACPVLVVGGSEDQVCPSSAQAELIAGIVGARQETISECGHMAPLERPEVVAALLRRWLEPTLPGSSLPEAVAVD